MRQKVNQWHQTPRDDQLTLQQEMVVKVEQVISDTKSWWESLKAETSPKRPLEYYLEQLYEKLVAEITAIADAAFEEVLKVVNTVVDKVDAVLEGIFGESTIRVGELYI